MKLDGIDRLFPDETTRQWFYYAVTRRGLSLFTNLLLLAIGVPAAGLGPMLLFLFAFLLLRRHAGGFHASSVFRCLLCSVLQTVLCVYALYPLLAWAPLVSTAVLACGSAFLVFRFAPLLPRQLHAGPAEIAASRARVRKYAAAELAGVLFLALLGFSGFAVCGSLGMAAAAASLLIENHLRKKEELKHELFQTERP